MNFAFLKLRSGFSDFLSRYCCYLTSKLLSVFDLSVSTRRLFSSTSLFWGNAIATVAPTRFLAFKACLAASSFEISGLERLRAEPPNTIDAKLPRTTRQAKQLIQSRAEKTAGSDSVFKNAFLSRASRNRELTPKH